ncbi:hypothetical protein ACFFQF_10655 [Haladaptatus pallidirubidus]|nr:hypothetical protein [Haladaptatus pallidirubidus]
MQTRLVENRLISKNRQADQPLEDGNRHTPRESAIDTTASGQQSHRERGA